MHGRYGGGGDQSGGGLLLRGQRGHGVPRSRLAGGGGAQSGGEQSRRDDRRRRLGVAEARNGLRGVGGGTCRWVGGGAFF